MSDKIEIGRKNELLEPGYVFAPYIIPKIVDINGRNKKRMQKISNIFNLGLNIDIFSPNRSITSRYAAVQISNPYNTFTIDCSI
jgi:hypothetical protein